MIDKISLRKSMKSLLSRDSESRLTKSFELSQNLLTYLNDYKSQNQFQRNLLVGVFNPLNDEPIWFRGVETEMESHFTLCLVNMEESYSLAFYPMPLSKIVKQGLEFEPSLEKVEPDVVLVPGLAFDKECNRLGRGRGYYDRYLSHYKGLKIGVFFERQLVEKVPTEENDIKLDLIITDQKKYIRGK